MKKLFGLVFLASLMFTGAANAATYYRVDFSGTVGNGTYDGFFTYDANLAVNPGADLFHVHQTEPDSSIQGFEEDLEFNYAYSGIAGSFNESNAGIGILIFRDSILSGWSIGGDETGIRSLRHSGPLDFLLGGNSDGIIKIPGNDIVRFESPIWTQTELSAVPLPAAVWAFGAGLVALFGLQRRRKAKAELAPA